MPRRSPSSGRPVSIRSDTNGATPEFCDPLFLKESVSATRDPIHYWVTLEYGMRLEVFKNNESRRVVSASVATSRVYDKLEDMDLGYSEP